MAGTAEILVAKQRHGPIGKVRLQFTGETTKFTSLDKHHDSDDAPF